MPDYTYRAVMQDVSNNVDGCTHCMYLFCLISLKILILTNTYVYY